GPLRLYEAVMRLPRRKTVVAWLSILGLVSFSFLAGAFVMFFELPGSAFLRKAFLGGQAWLDQARAAPPTSDMHLPSAEGPVARPQRPFDGLPLYTTARGSRALLVDMHGKVVHKWAVPFSRVWAKPPHIREPLPDPLVYFFSCHLYPNGDLLAVFHGFMNTPY